MSLRQELAALQVVHHGLANRHFDLRDEAAENFRRFLALRFGELFPRVDTADLDGKIPGLDCARVLEKLLKVRATPIRESVLLRLPYLHDSKIP